MPTNTCYHRRIMPLRYTSFLYLYQVSNISCRKLLLPVMFVSGGGGAIAPEQSLCLACAEKSMFEATRTTASSVKIAL